MTRKIIHQFDSITSTGLDKVPVNALIQVKPPSNDKQISFDLFFTLLKQITDSTKTVQDVVNAGDATPLGNSNFLEYDYAQNTLSIYFE